MMTAGPHLSKGLESLKATVAKLSAGWRKSLSAEATQASLIVGLSLLQVRIPFLLTSWIACMEES